MSWNRISGAFGVNQEQYDSAVRQLIDVDHSCSSLFTLTFTAPAYFATTACAGNDIACVRMFGDPGGKFAALVFRPVVRPEFAEQGGFDDGVHEAIGYVFAGFWPIEATPEG